MEKNLGHATAYGYAKSKGYSGTEDEFAELMADYASVGQSAAQSAEQAAASATSASGSAATASQAAQTATDKASEAVTAADTATTKASEASTSADAASAAAISASTSAQTATAKAGTATAKADEAAASEVAALSAKTDAESARDAAAQSASQAAESARTLTIDDTLTQSGQAADAKATGDAITESKTDLSPSESLLFDYMETGITTPGLMWSRGTIGNSGIDGSILYRIYTTNILTLSYNLNVIALTGFRFTIQTYNADGSYISGTGWRTNETITAGTHFRLVVGRTTEDTSEVADLLTFAKGIRNSTNYSYLVTSQDNRSVDSARALTMSNNELNSSGAKLANINAHCTDYIIVEPGKKIRIQMYAFLGDNSWKRKICYYKSDKTFLSSPSLTFYAAVFGNGYIETQELTVPANAAYMMVSLYTYQNPFSLIIDTGYTPFSTYSIANKAFISCRQKAHFNGCLPILHAGGYSGVYDENTVDNMMYNIINSGDGGKFKFVEVDVKCCSDLVWVVTHDQTFEYEGVTYTIKDTPSATAIAAGLPLAEPFIKLAHQFGFGIMWDIGGGIFSDAQLCSIVDLTKKYNMLPDTFIATGTRADLWVLARYCPQANLAFIKFAKPLASDNTQLAAMKEIMCGCLMVYLEKDTAVTLSEQDYIDGYRAQGIAFGIHGFRNADSNVLKNWAKICDYLCVPQKNAYELMMVYDFTT